MRKSTLNQALDFPFFAREKNCSENGAIYFFQNIQNPNYSSIFEFRNPSIEYVFATISKIWLIHMPMIKPALKKLIHSLK